MGTRKREHRERLSAAAKRVQESGGINALERWKQLRQTSNCQEADAAQAMELLQSGPWYRPVECPHCGEVPNLAPVLARRRPCAEIGHPEQAFRLLAGLPLVTCVLCGEKPTPESVGLGQRLTTMLEVMRSSGMLPVITF